MSLISSMYTGATGLESNTTDLAVIGDNIANANTIGFKASRASFSDAMSQQLIGEGSMMSQVGLGTHLQAVQKIITQGALTNTGLATDLAVDGNGYFVVSGTHNGSTGQFYTRAGQFTLDKTGFLVNLEGLHVQGYTASPTGVLGTTPGDLRVGNSDSPAVATTTITARANLDATTVPPTAVWDPTNPTGTSNFSNSITAYDSLGGAHQLDVYYIKTANPNEWTYHVMEGATEVGAAAGGTLQFNTDGTLQTHTPAAVSLISTTAVSPQAITLNFDAIADTPAGTGRTGLTQFAAPSGTASMNQDGYTSGSLTHIAIDKDGKINGSFTNGQSRVLGQVATAIVQSPDKMDRVGGNLFAATPLSGEPTLGAAGTAGRGGIVAGALEQSNVDLANEFVRMIAAQRGFQASSKTVTTADQLLAELMTLKR